MASKYLCRPCLKVVTATTRNRYRSHSDGSGEVCANSGEFVPADLLANGPEDGDPGVPKEGADFAVCLECERRVKLTRLGYFEPHDKTLRGGERCPKSGVRAGRARKQEDAPLPGDEKPKASAQQAIISPAPTSTSAGAADIPTEPPPTAGDRAEPSSAPSAGSGVSTDSNSPESVTTSTLSLAPLLDETILQPFSHILQPASYEKAVVQPMGDLAKELATKIKETFYAYSNRKTTDNRSAQTTLGPSEIGTPCDRRLAMALMGVPPVNPGGDGWAAFVGTCTHAGMAEVYTFADAGTGRYAVELPVFLGMPTVPRGTTDLLDRRDGTVVDWKVMGVYSLKKFKAEGPSETYRTQAHVYGLGAERGGETVRNVAVVGLPRAGSSLDEMHIWAERYDRKFAQAALDRVERIAREVDGVCGESVMARASVTPTGDDCRYCQFHLKGDKEMRRGCPGK